MFWLPYKPTLPLIQDKFQQLAFTYHSHIRAIRIFARGSTCANMREITVYVMKSAMCLRTKPALCLRTETCHVFT